MMKLRVFSARAPYRRGGLAFRDRLEPVLVAASLLTLEGLGELLADPVITKIEAGDGEDWTAIEREKPTELPAAIVNEIGNGAEAQLVELAPSDRIAALELDLKAVVEEREAARADLREVNELLTTRDQEFSGLRSIEAGLRSSVDQLTTERNAARDEADQLRSETAELREKVKELTAKVPAPSAPKPRGGRVAASKDA